MGIDTLIRQILVLHLYFSRRKSRRRVFAIIVHWLLLMLPLPQTLYSFGFGFAFMNTHTFHSLLNTIDDQVVACL